MRGIRVIVEFDSPGINVFIFYSQTLIVAHTRSWSFAHPEIFSTNCIDGDDHRTPINRSNLIDPTLNETWNFLDQFYDEILLVFPDLYVHLGGDEASFERNQCWFVVNNNIRDCRSGITNR